MVTLTTAHGTFEGQDIREAQAAARKAEREAKRVQAARDASYKLARARSEQAGYRVLMLLAGQHGGLERRTFLPPECKWCGVTRRERGDDVRYQTSDGEATSYSHGMRVVGKLTDAAGWDLAVVLRDIDNPEQVQVCAVGIDGAEVAFSPLPDTLGADCFAAAERHQD